MGVEFGCERIFEANAGVVGKDPMVSGQFQHGASSASSPPPDVDASLHEWLKRSSTGCCTEDGLSLGIGWQSTRRKEFGKAMSEPKSKKPFASRVVRAAIARGPARQVTQSGRLKTKYTRLRHFVKPPGIRQGVPSAPKLSGCHNKAQTWRHRGPIWAS